MNSFRRAILYSAPLVPIILLACCLGPNVHAAVPTAQIYWADTGMKIRRAELDGSNLVTVIANSAIGNIGDFVIDRRTNLVYINDGFDILRSNLDGTNLASIFQFPPESFRGDVTIDPVTNALFFVDGRNNAIYRSNSDGTGAMAIVPAHGTPSNTDGASDLWVDPTAGKLYWNYNDSIHRINLDGSQDEVLFSGAFGTQDFEIDAQHGKIYWAATQPERGAGTIRRANLDGTEQQTLVSNLWFANGIALDPAHGKMYYTDSWYSGPTNYDSTIRMANLDGASQQIIINLGPSSINLPFEITLDTAIVPEPGYAFIVLATSLVGFGGRRNRARCHPWLAQQR